MKCVCERQYLELTEHQSLVSQRKPKDQKNKKHPFHLLERERKQVHTTCFGTHRLPREGESWACRHLAQNQARTHKTWNSRYTVVPSGVVQQGGHQTTQCPCSDERKELLGSQHSWLGPVELWLASNHHSLPLYQTQTTSLYTGPS